MTYAVRFEHVTKRYPRGWSEGTEPRYASFRHDIASFGKRLVGRGRSNTPHGTLALQDVSFEVEEGESYALIGPNGAGKSTALKLICRISYPTEGRVRVRGRVAALMEVGSGVHPELTGRENIWLYGQILGLSKADVGRRFDEIVDFAELERAIDTPVKFFSSGMQLRLGFAIAAFLEPDVFVVDEALAVGDAGFQAKCIERMTRLVTEGRTLLFVSHNLPSVEVVCRRGVFLEGAGVKAEGEARAVIRDYLDWVEAEGGSRIGEGGTSYDSRFLSLIEVSCHGAEGEKRHTFRTGERMEIRLRFRAAQPLASPYVSIGITDGRLGNLILCSMLVDGGAPTRVEDEFVVSCTIDSLPLLSRVYEMWCSVREERAIGDLYDWQRVGSFQIAEEEAVAGPAAATLSATKAPIFAQHSWRVI